MKVAFFTEMGFRGKVPRNFPNCRTEYAWMIALDADHYNLKDVPTERYDLGIVINSKNHPEQVQVPTLKRNCDRVAVMQEGPAYYFQDYPLPNQIHYFNNLMASDIIFTHNEQDRDYFKGLTNHSDVRVLRSLMIEDAIDKITPPEPNR